MNKVLSISLVILLMLLSCGEKEKIVDIRYVEVPVEVPGECAPSAPQGVFSINWHDSVTICWYPNSEEDIDGYDIFKADSFYDNNYEYIGTVWIEDTSPGEDVCLTDRNNEGFQYFYAVVAFDRSGLESELSYDQVTGTARPEGRLRLYDRESDPDKSGYDFDLFAQQADTSSTTDIFFDSNSGFPELVAHRLAVDIQDYGYIESFQAINRAPVKGWAPSRRAEAVLNHCYIVRLDELDGYHYAKLFVEEVLPGSVTFKWAYQEVAENRDLAPPASTGGKVLGAHESPAYSDNNYAAKSIDEGFEGRLFPPSFKRVGNMDTEDD